ncbi:uncharacterized protein BDR25DRAFT_315154 [Lindgomyces ingoldianus]|uniref:Uncharacterized protein n=1 Tax=Lindgomyces ingoldianus TaxID=673940 RepID=A0ACB6QTP4_9PLEO|nr:uncharacterized protein BDR25DRAFT_315154 [Lindgomyces ingoldianus]KAF2469536.1 hypothetical protein BDR25DRAFT_315154 [Lindgomyces ingoldianus]
MRPGIIKRTVRLTNSYGPLEALPLASGQLSDSRSQRAHESLWRSVFRDETWLQLALDKFGVNPVLVGPDLYKYFDEPKEEYQNGYMVLLSGDLEDELRWERATFFYSLKKHKYDKATKEISFNVNCGITLLDY